MTKLAVFSDIHGNLVALEAMLADLESAGAVDMIWVLGDLAAMGPRPAECVRKIRDMHETLGKEKIKVIGGNTDRYLVTGERMKVAPAKDEETFQKLVTNVTNLDIVLDWNLAQLDWQDYEFLAKILHHETAMHIEGYGHVIGYHAIPGNDETILKPNTPIDEADDALLDREGVLGIGAHIHEQMDRQLTRWRVVNVGSVGMSFEVPGKAQWGLFTFSDGDVDVDLRIVPYDVDALFEDFKTQNYPAAVIEWAKSRMKFT